MARKQVTYIALLRGINVGGRNKLPMACLRPMFEELGCVDVRTYIQSGNVVYAASPSVARGLSTAIADSIHTQCKLEVPVVIRDAKQFRKVVESNPFLTEGADLASLSVAFLADRPTARHVASLDPLRSPPDEFIVVGTELYLRYPNGVARSKLTNAYFDARLGTTSTVRNWRTVGKVLAMATE